ncbi:hypothetical protein D1872_50850 [compost metagenome]
MEKIPSSWNEDMSIEQQKDLAYWERNMLALYFGVYANRAWDAYNKLMIAQGKSPDTQPAPCGWYAHVGEGFEGWSRVISLFDGKLTFHVPDNFYMGTELPEIEPNWDGHTTEEKWRRVMKNISREDW